MQSVNALLLVEPDPAGRASLGEALRQSGCEVVVADGMPSASRYLRLHAFQGAVVSLDLPGDDLWTCIKEVRAQSPLARLVGLARRPDIRRTVQALRAGMLDVIETPCSAAAILRVIRDASPSPLPLQPEPDEVLGKGPRSAMLREQVKRLSTAPPAPVLFQGETGAGRSFLARAVHRNSARRARPFRAIDCATLPKPLLEVELFGRPGAAFRGALGDGSRGTVVLQNAGELPPAQQTRLAAVLAEAMQKPESAPWVMATSSLDLNRAVIEGRFRRDLFFALSGYTVVVPPLRARPEDIPVLARSFVDGFAAGLNRPPLRFTRAAEARLVEHAWPSNIRELKGVCEYALVLCSGETIDECHLYFEPGGGVSSRNGEPDGPSLTLGDWSLRTMERALIDHVLERVRHNITQAARELGINRSTLYNKMKEYDLGRCHKQVAEQA